MRNIMVRSIFLCMLAMSEFTNDKKSLIKSRKKRNNSLTFLFRLCLTILLNTHICVTSSDKMSSVHYLGKLLRLRRPSGAVPMTVSLIMYYPQKSPFVRVAMAACLSTSITFPGLRIFVGSIPAYTEQCLSALKSVRVIVVNFGWKFWATSLYNRHELHAAFAHFFL